MELLFNLIWAAVIVALWALWAGGRRSRRKASLRPAIGAQLIALAMLSLILLPAISITDDLQAYHNPAEVQRTYDRNDRYSLLAKSAHSLPAAWALIAFSLNPQPLRTIAFLNAGEANPRQQFVHIHTVWSRPPPSA